jgi:hypothetical protein
VKIVILKLKNSQGRIISRNTYWISEDNNFSDLNGKLHTKAVARVTGVVQGKTDKTWTILFANQTSKVAFFLRAQIMADGEEVLPSWWSANYFTLAPSDQLTIKVSCPLEALKGRQAVMRLSGWNTDPLEFPLK